MPFVKSLIGGGLSLNQDGSIVSRSKLCSHTVNENTIAYYPHLITQGTIIGFTCKLDLKEYGFGKIGLSAASPHDVSISDINLMSLLREDDESRADINVIEVPKFDSESGSLMHNWGCTEGDTFSIYLILVCGNNNRVSVFANFTLLGKLEVSSELKSGGVSIFLDLSGCLVSVLMLEEPYCLGRAEMFDSEQAWLTYCRELASYGGMLFHANNLGVFLPHSGQYTEQANRLLDDLHIKPRSEKDSIRHKTIMVTRDPQSGKVKPKLDTWTRAGASLSRCQNDSLSTIFSQDSTESEGHHQQYIEEFGIKQRENTDLQSIHGKSEDSSHNFLEFLNAEENAVRTVKGDKKKEKTAKQQEDFSSLQIKESTLSPRDSEKSLVDKLTNYFIRTNSFNKSDCVTNNRDYSIGDTNNSSSVQYQSSIKYPDESVLSVDVGFYNSICQLEIMMMIGVVSHGPFVVIQFIQEFVKEPTDENLLKLTRNVDKLCRLMSQRAPEQFIKKSLYFLCGYDQNNLEDQLGTEKFYKNLNVVKNAIEEICYKPEFKEMMFQNPIYLNSSSTGYKSETYEICGCLCDSLVENVGYFVPQRWARLLKAIRNMKKPGIKLLSMSQSCQLAADHGLKTVMEVSACLSWLDICQFVHWCPRGSVEKSITNDLQQKKSHHDNFHFDQSDPHNQYNQSRVLLLDFHWISQITETLERESRSRFANKQEDSAFPTSLEILDVISKPFSYHKPLLLHLLRQSGLLSDVGLKLCPVVCALDFPSSFDCVTLDKITSRTKYSEVSDKSLAWFLQFSSEPPWLCVLSVMIRILSMCDTNFSTQNSHSSDVSSCNINYRQCSVSIQFQDETCLYVSVHNPSQLKVQLFSPHGISNGNLQLGSIQTYLEQQCRLQISRAPLYKLGIMSGVECPCSQNNKTSILGKMVKKHHDQHSTQVQSRHILKLNEVLYSKAVFCGEGGNRLRVSTEPWRSLFLMPTATSLVNSPSPVKTLVISDSIIIEKVLNGNIGQCINYESVPGWLKKLAKMLSPEITEHDQKFTWTELAEILGYKDAATRFSRSSQPALSILLDWIVSSGNCALSVEFLSIVLQEAGQYTTADFIDANLVGDEDQSSAQVFVSYQWHSRAEARAISDFLALHGVSVWMDIGPTISLTHTTGTHLLHRIERALRRCQVMIACITPRYIVSPFSHRELVLTELLGKPIVPVMLARVPWPPPGGSGLLLAPYVYIDLYGVGGHGGSGKNADVNARMMEILAQISKYIDVPLPDPRFMKPNQDNSGFVGLQSKLQSPNPASSNPNLSHHHLNDSASSSRHTQSHESRRTITHDQSGAVVNRHHQIPSRVNVRECSSVCTLF